MARFMSKGLQPDPPPPADQVANDPYYGLDFRRAVLRLTRCGWTPQEVLAAWKKCCEKARAEGTGTSRALGFMNGYLGAAKQAGKRPFMETTRLVRVAQEEERAWYRGKAFAEKHPFAEFAGDEDSERMYRVAQQDGVYPEPFDIFKYGAQSVWRARGEIQ